MSPLLLCFEGRAPFAASLARLAGFEEAPVALHRFPDGESLVRLDARLAGRDCIVFCTLRAPDEILFPLLAAAYTARELGARSVGLLAPYLAYMRQDRRFNAGEAVSSRPFAQLISTHFDWLVTVDPHLHRYPRLDALYRLPSTVVSAVPLMADWLRRNVDRPVLVGPDEESLQWVGAVAELAGAPFVVLEKRRHGDADVEIAVPDIERWRDRTPVLVDDILSTGQTLAQTVRGLRAQGLAAPLCLAVHAVFAGDAERRLADAGAARLVTANTIAHATNAIDLTAPVAHALRTHLRRT
ncbi:ribose-phosphate pyrophosphokinase [Fontimonas sp. SYSU GA230001]|uniref:ribose-phosphate pyrophosphokinase n=1 Tax=Fontimonas sp. SYSU GA230001 TaxID=3142450 RepID=UPI0032B43C97